MANDIYSSRALRCLPALAVLAAASVQAGELRTAAADFNNDQRPEVAVLRQESALSHGRAQFSLELFRSIDTAPLLLDEFDGDFHSRIVVRDIDGDHDIDLVLISVGGRATRVWLNDGAGHLSPVSATPYAHEFPEAFSVSAPDREDDDGRLLACCGFAGLSPPMLCRLALISISHPHVPPQPALKSRLLAAACFNRPPPSLNPRSL